MAARMLATRLRRRPSNASSRIIGEALNRLQEALPDLAETDPRQRRIIDFQPANPWLRERDA